LFTNENLLFEKKEAATSPQQLPVFHWDDILREEVLTASQL
jgi:hypothetical protein